MGVFVKMFHFVPFYVHFWSKLTPKVAFSLKHGAFFTGRYHMVFKTKNGFIGDIGKHIKSFVSEFASLVPKMGLEPLNLRFFLRNMGVAKSPFLFVWIFREAVYLNIPILV
mgnify:CR=1 FL=1